MIENERRQENRHSRIQQIGVYLSQGLDGAGISPVFSGQLLSISRSGAGIALDKIMSGSTHMVYGPMESDALQLNIIFSFQDSKKTITVPALPVWLDKKQSENIPPFHIGVEFIKPLTNEQLQQLNRQLN